MEGEFMKRTPEKDVDEMRRLLRRSGWSYTFSAGWRHYDDNDEFVAEAVAGLFGAVSFRGVGGREVDMSSSAHSGARKVWPESD